MGSEAIDAVLFGMPGIEGHFVVHPEEDEDGRGHANGEAEDVDEGGGLIAPETAQGDEEVISEHAVGFLETGYPELKKCQFIKLLIIKVDKFIKVGFLVRF